MKAKYIYGNLMLIALLGLFPISCSLDYDPVGQHSDVTEGVKDDEGESEFKDKKAIDDKMRDVYDLIKNQEYWYQDYLLISESHSDNAYAGAPGAEVEPYENNSIEGSNSVLDRDWKNYLKYIGEANKIIYNVDLVNDNSFTTAERERYKAQAKIFRALVYFDMVRLWGNLPIIDGLADDITSENIVEVYPQYFPEQHSEQEVYEFIEKDLLESLASAPDNNPSDKTRLSKSVAHALLAKLYAEKPLRDYNKVIQYADMLATSGFDLNDDYSDLFAMNETVTDIRKRNTRESILEAQFVIGGGNWVTWMFGRDLVNGDLQFTWAKWVTPSRDLINAFNQENDKIRFEESVVYYSCGWSIYYPSDNYPFMYKCRSAYNSLIKLRYADILLLKAEALIMKEGPDLAGAANIIDKVRARVNLDKLPSSVRSSKDSMLDALLKERRLELAFEGQRWYDLCRLDKVEEVMNAVFAKDSGRKKQIYPFTENSYKLAIPQAAIDQNVNLTQNPGY